MSTFSPRQTYYLRIGPYTVLQMVLYLEPGPHVRWMSDTILDRILQALRTRIPQKLREEIKRAGGKKGTGSSSGSGKDKLQVDVYRGVGFQIAYFFRQSSQRHAVLLKDKQIQLPEASVTGERPAKRRRANDDHTSERTALDVQTQVDDDVIIKDEPADDSVPGLDPVEGVSGGDHLVIDDEDEDQKPDVKPTLKVNYQGFSIYRRSLVVVVEPWPPLQAGEFEGPSAEVTEIRQLSASVAPRSMSVASTPGPSATPMRRRRESQTPLFRLETTPLSDIGEGASDGEGEQGGNEAGDESWRGLREASLSIANWEGDVGEDEELPELVRRRGVT